MVGVNAWLLHLITGFYPDISVKQYFIIFAKNALTILEYTEIALLIVFFIDFTLSTVSFKLICREGFGVLMYDLCAF